MSDIALCIATTGRAVTLTETLRNVIAQTRRPDRVILCPAKDGDVDAPAIAALPLDFEIVHGAPGASAQRNTLLRAARDADIVLFIDDDFLLAPGYLAALERLFDKRSDCVAATGLVIADGATNRGYTVDEGRAILAAFVPPPVRIAPVFNTYGCNMAFRWSRLRETDCLFDENLPLYSWAEDVDFSRQTAAYGAVLEANTLVGVHLAEKRGRTSGVRFGYSQIANQFYLARKGTITARGGLQKMVENVVANALGALRNDEPWIDRRGRLIGNLRGLRDVVIGRSSPGRILEF